MKVIFFTKYSRKGASSRLRTFQFLGFFEKHGIECTVNDFFTDEYLEELYRHKRHNKWMALKSFLRRALTLLKVKRYDKVVIEKELFPYIPAIAEYLLKLFGVRYIVDYDDAIFHNYDISPNPVIRMLLKNKIPRVMKYSAVVVAGNEYLRAKAESSGARRVIIIPTVIDVDKYTVLDKADKDAFVVGWIGSPITFKYLIPFRDLFAELAATRNMKFRFIGASRSLEIGPAEELVKWTEQKEAAEIQSFDVGIMPLEDNVWERGKCGYKLIQYMGCGIPVIGTPIGVNNDLIVDGYNGYKSSSMEQWKNRLIQMAELPRAERTKMGMNGRRLVEDHYSLQVYRQRWLSLLKETDK